MDLYIRCKNSGKIISNQKNIKKCNEFIEKFDWELSGLNKWIYFGEELIELFVDNYARNNNEIIENKNDDYYLHSYDNREDEMETRDEWYSNNLGIVQLFTTRLGGDWSDWAEESWADDDTVLFELVNNSRNRRKRDI